MKGSCIILASVIAASTVALSSSSNQVGGSKMARKTVSSKDEFAPKFDGLRHRNCFASEDTGLPPITKTLLNSHPTLKLCTKLNDSSITRRCFYKIHV
ncbi:hypothetical protein Leryth_005606 [Lithospermum erythrorhizon]|nr:hypothetical protein Leryth_005606 [Lithospermum erythrorhizon]